jgi:hypothetical protein
MHKLQDLFDKKLQDQYKFSIIVADLIESELAKQDIHLTAKHKKQLIIELDKNQDNFNDTSTIQFNDDGSVQFTNKTGSADFELDILEGAQEKMNSILEHLPAMINESSDVECEKYLANIKKRTTSILRENQKHQRSFNKQLNKKWGELLDLLEVFIVLSEDIGADFTDDIINLPKEDTSPRFTVLSRSHARSCQVSKEIITLLRNGFADGAHARWRTLHEIAVETNIINKNQDELAQRYIDYDLVQRLQAARAFHKYDQEFGVENVTQEELQDLETACKELDELYGKDFRNENGWANDLTGKPKPKFSDLEALADFAHMRPQYKLACLNVHGGPRALFFRFGLRYDGDENFLLTGSSTSGLANPAQNTAYSLLQISAALLTYDVNLDYLVALKVLFKLEQEIFDVASEIVEKYYDE